MNTTLYPGIAFSPQAELTDNIGAADTIIPVSDAAAFPEAPNLATIGTDEEGETILYTAKTANALSGCRRGVEGTAKSWQAGEPIGRNFTAKDHADLIAEVREAAKTAEAGGVTFDDGETFQEKYDSGELVGPVGKTGAPGKDGPQGPTGKTAYQYAVDGGYTGTEAQFQALLNDIPNKQPKLRGSAGQVVGFNTQGAAVAVRGWSNPNLLDNWYFQDPVNQRGQTSYENTTYTIDRWLATGNGQTVSLTDEGLKIAFKDNANEYCNISERFENYQQYAGKTFTASALIRNPDGNMVKLTVKPTPTGNGAGPWSSPDPPASDDWILITGTGVFSETPTGLSFMLYTFNPKQETTVFVKAMKLELGSQQTLAHQDAAGNWVLNDIPNKVEETKKCQRYQKVFSWGTRNFTAFYGFTTSATTANLFLPVGVPLRITPTILDTRGENWAITLNGNTIIPEAIQTWFASDTMIGIRVKAEYPTGAHHFVTLNSNSANNVIFDANL